MASQLPEYEIERSRYLGTITLYVAADGSVWNSDASARDASEACGNTCNLNDIARSAAVEELNRLQD